MSINSVFKGFKQRRFDAIQEEICLIRRRRLSMDSAKLFEEKKMKIGCHRRTSDDQVRMV